MKKPARTQCWRVLCYITWLQYCFIGTSHFCVTRYQIEKMCSDLTTMKQAMLGNTTHGGNDSDASITFQMKPHRQVIVYGEVGGSHEENYLKFSFQTDQTCIESLLTDFHKLLKNEKPTNIYEAIDLILWQDWNPIGINDIAPRDEYQSHTPTVFKLKISGADSETIAKTLHKIETETIGVLGNIDHCRQVVDKIINLK